MPAESPSEPSVQTLVEDSPGPSPAWAAPRIEAALLSTDRPLTAPRLAAALGLIEPEDDEASPESPARRSAPPAPSDPSAPTLHTAEGEIDEPAAEPAEPPAPVVKTRKPSEARLKARREAAAKVIGLIEAAIKLLNEQYDLSSRSFRVEPVAGGYRLMTLPAFAPIVAAVNRARGAAKLTRAAVETLAIIAYRQPITRAELESIRGVACGEVVKTLMERRLVTIKGRAEELGRPILYGTTRQFLDHFGLPSLADLPTLAELKPST